MKYQKKSSAAYLLIIITSLILFFSFLITFSNKISATSHNNKSLSIVLIGDSYTAGNGAGGYNGPLLSYRSNKNWGSNYNNWLKSNGVKSTLTNLAWSGKKTSEINLTQIPEIPQNTDLVMFTAGGNDAEFSEAVKRCFAAGLRSSLMCRERIEHAKREFPNIIEGTRTILKSLETKLPSTSEVVLVGYPLLSLDIDNYVLNTCTKYDSSGETCLRRDSYDAAKAVRDTGKELTKKQAELVKEWNKSSPLKVTFVDTQPSFATHEPYPSTKEKNPKRWINEFFERDGDATEDGNGITDTKAIFSGDQNKWYHPNIIGHRKIALDIINQVGVPSSAKEITKTSSDTDIVFVVDTTGSMGGAIDSVKYDINTIAIQIKNMSKSTRFSLISYQDHPEYSGGGAADYPARTHLDFTHDIYPFIASVNSLGLGDGGDWPESVYSGAMAGLDQSWRPGVRKIMIIIGDAPAHDPEPITGYTWQQVAQRAYDIDPVEVYAIDVGNGGLASPEILQLTSQSGGRIIDASFEDIPQAIVNTVSESLAKPFGWIQGPYIIKVGDSLELDGRGSYAVNGEIEKIEWDLDGDGAFETTSTDLLYTRTFTSEFGGTIGIRITDTNGNIGIGSTRLDVTDDGDTIPRHIDNCPDIANQNQADFDEDGIGDDCDDDVGWPTEDLPGTFVTYGKNEVAPAAAPTKHTTQPVKSTSTRLQPPTHLLTRHFTATTTSTALPFEASQPSAENNLATNTPSKLPQILNQPSSTDSPQSISIIVISSVILAIITIIGIILSAGNKKRHNP